MNQHLLVKMRQLCVANLGKAQNTRSAHGASLRLAITSDWRLDLAHFTCAAE
jgi:hypothetical protein